MMMMMMMMMMMILNAKGFCWMMMSLVVVFFPFEAGFWGDELVICVFLPEGNISKGVHPSSGGRIS